MGAVVPWVAAPARRALPSGHLAGVTRPDGAGASSRPSYASPPPTCRPSRHLALRRAGSRPEEGITDDLAELIGEGLTGSLAADLTHLEQIEVVGDLDGLRDVLIDKEDRDPRRPGLE